MDYEQWDKDPRQSDYPYHTYYYRPQPSAKKRKRAGLWIVLVVLALITGVISWTVNFMDMQTEPGEKEASLFRRQTEPELYSVPEEEIMTAREEPIVNDKETLVIGKTPKSVENIPASQEDALSLQQIYEKVYPSVASISCIKSGGSGTGTGIVMSRDGYVITNYHVIEEAQQIYVLLGENDRYEAELVGGDEITDLAVLKVQAANLQKAEFGDSDVLRVGDAVVAIGDPLGTQLRGTMTDGIVSAINRDLNLSGRKMTLIQTNAALNSGNSGGPLINCYGQIVGINTMKIGNYYSSSGATVEGIGFAIPITQAKPILDELISQGYVSGRPAIGIQGQAIDLRGQLFYHLPAGVLITGILEDSDAHQKGLEPDDVIVGFNGMEISSLDDLVAAKDDYEAGDLVELTIYRGGRYYRVEITLMDQIKPEIY